jgi:hypothetical protein
VAGFEPNDDVRVWHQEFKMPQDERVRADKAFLDDMRRDRAVVREEIRQSQLTIEESKELLGRMEAIAKTEKKE